jgi:hypothetical protein
MDSPLPSVLAAISTKRPCEPSGAPAAKAPRLSGTTLSQHTRASLAALSPEALLDVAAALAARCRTLEASPATPGPVSAAVPAAAAPSPEALAEQKARFCAVALRQIRAQMKWKPSCKTGGARFSFEGMCAPALYQALMREHLKPKERLPGGLKESSAKKLSLSEFRAAFNASWSDTSAPIRYGSLSVGDSLTLRYNAGTGELKITGSYGL